MPIPDFQTIMSPLLTYTIGNNEHSLRDTAEIYGRYFINLGIVTFILSANANKNCTHIADRSLIRNKNSFLSSW